MHLQSLELIGFKSFADKTLFEFHEGVTAIVGPNGCGKSNVLDAVRWVLGEQSAKALRGGEMADVIFNGTETRKPLGFGEVSLTLTNCGSDLGVEWHDVRVTRRVHRDGNSEYFLNKTPCRLRDIQSLFADTGLGRSSYSVMEQGKIDLILSSRPEDRRTVFEEAAGITKYKTQKREALRKLEATDANLLRIGDIIREVKRQIGSLQRQAGKARRYQALLTDLQVLDTHYSHRQLTELHSEVEAGKAEVTRLVAAEKAAQIKIQSDEDELTAKRRDLEEIDQRIGDSRAEVQRLQSDLAALRSRIELNQQRGHELRELVQRYENDIAAAEKKRSEQEVQIQEADALIASIDHLLDTKEAELEELTDGLQSARSARAQSENELQSLQHSLSKLEGRITALQNDLTGVTARREATTARITDLSSVLLEETRRAKTARVEVTRRQQILEKERQTTEERRESLRNTEEEQQQRLIALADAEKEIARFDRLIAEKQARLEVLRQMTEQGEGLEKGSQAVLKGLNEPDRIKPAISGALVANLNVDPEFVPALEAAFGRAMHAVVLNDATLATEIFQSLTDNKLGQAALAIPEWSIDLADVRSAALPNGAIGWAIDKVGAPDTLAPIVRGLLHNVVIMPDLEAVLRLKKTEGVVQYVTLKGEFVSANGIIFGGSGNGATDSLLARKTILEKLAQECDALERDRKQIIAARDRAQEQVDAAVTEVEDARRNYEIAQQSHVGATAQILSAEQVVRDVEQKLNNLQAEKNTLEQQIRTADETVAQLEAELRNQRNAFDQEQELQNAAENAREKALSREEETRQQLNELRLALATERQRHESLLNHRQPMAVREAELRDLVTARRSDIATYQSRLAILSNESQAAEANILRQTLELEKANTEVAALTQERAVRLTTVGEQEFQVRGLRDSLNDLRDSRGKQEVRHTQLQLKIENLIEHVMRRYQVDLRVFITDLFAFQKTLSVVTKRRAKSEAVENGVSGTEESTTAEKLSSGVQLSETGEDLEEVIATLTRQLDNMGPVNLEAVQEYDELEERHRFLETQNNDLVAARRELLDVISRINNTTKKLFADTFAQVRINFREMFRELFDGGRAELSLVDENDPLNCGIEISAKPPGKQTQSISLLSGGERTMTAVALLFAIYMVRPSPFCILDEMDAALDESNINRFIRVLERFVTQSQFVIITHNKRTIAKADVLYGVTMEDRGVSKLVGVKLAAERGSDGTVKQQRPLKAHPQERFEVEGAEHEPTMALSN